MEIIRKAGSVCKSMIAQMIFMSRMASRISTWIIGLVILMVFVILVLDVLMGWKALSFFFNFFNG